MTDQGGFGGYGPAVFGAAAGAAVAAAQLSRENAALQGYMAQGMDQRQARARVLADAEHDRAARRQALIQTVGRRVALAVVWAVIVAAAQAYDDFQALREGDVAPWVILFVVALGPLTWVGLAHGVRLLVHGPQDVQGGRPAVSVEQRHRETQARVARRHEALRTTGSAWLPEDGRGPSG